MKPTRLSWRDLASEAIAGLASRPARTLLTVLGTVLGISALVATVGIAQTAGNRIVGAFDELSATSVVVTNESPYYSSGGPRTSFPRDAEDRISRLNGVTAVGVMGTVTVGEDLASTVKIDDPTARNEFQIDVRAASPGLLAAVKGEMRMGRWFDSGHETRADDVVVLGPGAADKLNIHRVDSNRSSSSGTRPTWSWVSYVMFRASPSC